MTLTDHFRNEGIEIGRLEGRIEIVQTLQRILGRPVDSADTLGQLSAPQFASLIDQLTQDLGGHPN